MESDNFKLEEKHETKKHFSFSVQIHSNTHFYFLTSIFQWKFSYFWWLELLHLSFLPLFFGSITFPTPTNLVQHDLHGSLKSHPNGNNKPVPSPKPIRKFISIELQISNTTKPANKQCTSNFLHPQNSWTIVRYFDILCHHELRLLPSFHPHPHKMFWH
jgi:hypothetical protein